jgi:hypothetical protein
MTGQHLNDRIWLVNTNPIIAPGWSNNLNDRNWWLELVLGIRDILVRIRTRIREAQKHTDPTDPD